MKLYMNISFFYEGGLFGVDSIIKNEHKKYFNKTILPAFSFIVIGEMKDKTMVFSTCRD